MVITPGLKSALQNGVSEQEIISAQGLLLRMHSAFLENLMFTLQHSSRNWMDMQKVLL